MTRKRWQFVWCDENSPPTGGDAHNWKSKVFRVATFEKALDKMLEFINAKPFACMVDYECRAMHVREKPKQANYNEVYHRIPYEHSLSEHVF